jgi:1-phosphofructokinase
VDNTAAILTVTLNPAIDRTIEVENLTPGAHQVGRTLRRRPGGKGVNVSCVLAAMGIANTATGFVGAASRDLFGAALAQTGLAKAGVGFEFITIPGATRENITLIDPARQQETHIRDRGLAVDAEAISRMDAKLRQLSPAGGVVVFSGSLPPGMSAADLAALAEICTTAGARVAVDTSGEGISACVDRKLWLAKPNAAELAEGAGRPLKTREDLLAAGRQLAGHVEMVLLSVGADGAYLITRQATLLGRASLPAERVRNTVGCGDVLLGAFLAAWSTKPDPAEALRTAVATATAAAATDTTAEFQNELADELREKITVTDVPTGQKE